MFRSKYNVDSTLNIFNDGLVAKGYWYTEGVDYFDIYALVGQLEYYLH